MPRKRRGNSTPSSRRSSGTNRQNVRGQVYHYVKTELSVIKKFKNDVLADLTPVWVGDLGLQERRDGVL